MTTLPLDLLLRCPGRLVLVVVVPRRRRRRKPLGKWRGLLWGMGLVAAACAGGAW